MFEFFSTPGMSVLLYMLGIAAFSACTIARTTNRTRAMVLEIMLMHSVGIIGFSGMSNFVIHAFSGRRLRTPSAGLQATSSSSRWLERTSQ